ncbi:MAG: hypothetical protein QN174_13340 [Armatimonadota bacterium]|nr:hypothetical protein [Armatimonadota bacterium]
MTPEQWWALMRRAWPYLAAAVLVAGLAAVGLVALIRVVLGAAGR